jgi:hypothetical protein
LPVQYTVTASISAESSTLGTITAPLVQNINNNSNATYTITPNAGNFVHSITGTCPAGTWSGNNYTTGAITSACTVIVKFMDGTLTSSAASCTIALNGSSCTVNL